MFQESPRPMYDTPNAPLEAPLEPAPGARAARVCGILAIVLALSCVGIPIAVGLAITALVKQGRARREAQERPDLYLQPGGGAQVMGLLGLALSAVMLIPTLISAIAIPAFLAQRARVRDKMAAAYLHESLPRLAAQYIEISGQRLGAEATSAQLDDYLRRSGEASRNPWDASEPACSEHLEMSSGQDLESAEAQAKAGARRIGQCVYLLQPPAGGRPGFLVGAVRLRTSAGTGTDSDIAVDFYPFE